MGTAAGPGLLEATRLGSYEILRKIARGGMAELYLARTKGPEGFEKIVVLKKILPNYAENPKFVRLFLDEARLAATLDHPNIAHVYDMGTVDGNYFFTMEYIHGQDVRTTMRRTLRLGEKFPIDDAVQIARHVASALHYAHERRRPDGSLLDLVHRDVSPSNILISYDGAVKLVDFGVAKAATSSVKTRTGTLKGKISYMSPEQAKGAPIDRRSDLFSLGIVLWEMVTTQRLFKADNDLATIQMIVNSKPTPPSHVRVACPLELERIIMKALEADPAGRYQTAEELQLDLEELAREAKLKQSTVVLRAHMHVLFDAEIKAWKDAQASGITLTDHVIGATGENLTTPVSESELEYVYEDEDVEEEDEDSTVEPPTALQPKHGAVSIEAPTIQMSGPPEPEPPLQQPSVMLGRVDQTPIPARGDHTPMPNVPSRVDHTPSGAGATASPFPVAPREWRPAPANPPTEELRLGRQKQSYAIAGAVAFAVLVLAALLFAGGEHHPRGASAPVGEGAPATAPAPAVEPAPAPSSPSAPAPQAASEPAAAPAPPPAAEPSPAPATEPPPAAPVPEPATDHAPPAAKPAALPKPAKAVTPAPKPRAKPESHKPELEPALPPS